MILANVLQINEFPHVHRFFTILVEVSYLVLPVVSGFCHFGLLFLDWWQSPQPYHCKRFCVCLGCALFWPCCFVCRMWCLTLALQSSLVSDLGQAFRRSCSVCLSSVVWVGWAFAHSQCALVSFCEHTVLSLLGPCARLSACAVFCVACGSPHPFYLKPDHVVSLLCFPDALIQSSPKTTVFSSFILTNKSQKLTTHTSQARRCEFVSLRIPIAIGLQHWFRPTAVCIH